MKLNNEFLVFDLETTSGKDEEGNQTNNDIIQIGAVLLDRSLNQRATFNYLVKPRESISQYITDLTGITNKDVENEPDFNTVANEFERYFFQFANNYKTIRLCAWGNYFDIPILRKLYREYKRFYPFSGSAFDIKTLAMFWMSMSGHRTDKLSVEHVADVMGIKPVGNYHNAMVDAQTEADILRRIFTDFNNGVFVDGKLLKIS